jgi:hypothetical protein
VGGALVILIVLIMIVKAIAGGGGAKEPKAGASASVSPETASSTPAPPEVLDCVTANVMVGLEADGDNYEVGDRPTFTATVTNAGQVACVVDPANVELNIVSGSDQIFNSLECPVAGAAGAEESEPVGIPSTTSSSGYEDEDEDAGSSPALSSPSGVTTERAPGEVLLLQPSQSDTLPLTWNALRSNATCDSGLPEPGRPGTYRATATIAEVVSEDAVFKLL